MDNRRRSAPLQAVLLAVLLVGSLVALGATPAQGAGAAPSAPTLVQHIVGGFEFIKFIQPGPLCTGVGYPAVYWDELDCGFGLISIGDTDESDTVTVRLLDPDAEQLGDTQTATWRTEDSTWEFTITPVPAWPDGVITAEATVAGDDGPAGSGSFLINTLGATVTVTPAATTPGTPVTVSGTVFEQDQVTIAPVTTPVAASFVLQLVTPDGEVRGPFPETGSITAAADGTFSYDLPAEATAGLTAGPETNFTLTVSAEVVNAHYTDPLSGAWGASKAGAGSLSLSVPPDRLLVDNNFVSAVGWVKPGESYPSRVIVRNYTGAAAGNTRVDIAPVDGMQFTSVTTTPGGGTAVIAGNGSIRWSLGVVGAGSPEQPTFKTLIVEATTDTLAVDPQVVWRDLSTTAVLTYTGGPVGNTSKSHGPKVIPLDESFDTARYGDRPFPVVPVDFQDRKHDPANSGERLATVINDPQYPGSTFNLFQEMSYGQLFPNGTVPSAGIATADWTYGPGFEFTSLEPAGTCHGATFADFTGTPLLPERIDDGFYQLPGNTDYYGDDKYGSALGGQAHPLLQDIDSACGDTGKAVYDAAQIADPEIDYSDYDTDKDGVVDFFMMVFVGCGGNGASQAPPALCGSNELPYDNIWPHSSSLEGSYVDAATGLKGYISDDQLKNLEGELLFYTDDTYSQMTTTPTAFPVMVRVGPYNVNPESAIQKASVISHEYGHSLGLPDFYTLSGRETYGTWNLMAEDHSQNMDVFSRQELGWLVPQPIPDGETTVNDWVDSKTNTHTISWQTPAGVPYTLSGPGVNNGQAYVAKLPSRQLIDPAKFDDASPTHAWWTRSGNDFGCTPASGHNLDFSLSELESVTAGTEVTLDFKSLWDIEWDYDYGFVMVTTDGGETYEGLPSANGYSTPSTQNPNNNACLTQYGNGLTGSSSSYLAGTQALDRLLAEYGDPGFIADSYDLSAYAGMPGVVLRFSYSTDPGLARPGWFIDDLTVTAGGDEIFATDFETSGGEDDPHVYNGGCKDGGFSSATHCTDGFELIDAAAGSPADHAYYVELRDRSGFDLDGHGQDDRGNGPTWGAGLSLVYTDEAHGYGNVGVDDPPAQSPLDAQPQPGNNTPNLDDAAFNAGESFSDTGAGWTDNYLDPSSDDGNWHFAYDCLRFTVDSMTGDSLGPPTGPGDLRGDVTFNMGDSCAPFDYGAGGDVNARPTAVAQSRPHNAEVGESIAFDASGSFDDIDPASALTYEWDFEGDGFFEASGRSVQYAYARQGEFDATLRVTDTGGLSDTDILSINVQGPPLTRNYWTVATNGTVVNYGKARTYPLNDGVAPTSGVVDIASTYDRRPGYWVVTNTGAVSAWGDADLQPKSGGPNPSSTVVAMIMRRDGDGYWLVDAQGRVTSYGTAAVHPLSEGTAPTTGVVGIAATATGEGYWLVTSRGAVSAYGDAVLLPNSSGVVLPNKGIVDIDSTNGLGYWITTSRAVIAGFGNAPVYQPNPGDPTITNGVVGMSHTRSLGGYHVVTVDSVVGSYGHATVRQPRIPTDGLVITGIQHV